ncbi:MAG: DUF4270 family protein [Sphingobacteriaceae bacterium]|nr:DUF4270 family protein [Sphingobacteriaceae bacterium]
MKYFKLDLLTLLISLFIFSSCEKDGTIGLDIDAQDSVKTAFTDTVTVRTTTVLEDDVATSGILQNPFGRIDDPVFGTTTVSLALGLSLPFDNYKFGVSPTLDSAILVLKYGDEFFGDSLTSKYVIDVHELSDNTPFSSLKTYTSKSVFEKATVRIGGLPEDLPKHPVARRFQWKDSTTVVSVIKGAFDKIVNVAPQIRIPITNTTFINRFFTATENDLKNNTNFAKHIKGLYVSIDSMQSTGNGGLTFFNLQSEISSLEIYYKSGTGTAKDTNVAKFRVSGASEIKRKRKPTVQTQIDLPSQNYPTVYAQPLSGSRIKLNFPYIKQLAAKGNVSINKAELFIPVVQDPTDPFRLKPAPRLTLYRTDIAGQRQAVPDNAMLLDSRYLDERVFGGFYDATEKAYKFNISSYIQDLVNKAGVIQYDTYIAPFDQALTNRANITAAATTAARVVLGGPNPQSPGKSLIKLRITYTKPN